MEYRDGTSSRRRGFSLVELSVAIAVAVIGLAALAGVMVSVSHQREQVAARSQVLAQAEALLEEILGVPPEEVKDNYGGMTFPVPGVAGTLANGRALSVSVDSTTQPKLLTVTIAGSWRVAGKDETLSLESRVYNPRG
jgi:prepilin-type N-terminal cleavage/methylation domain-containing protein